MEMNIVINWITENWMMWLALIIICGGYNLLIGISTARKVIHVLFGKKEIGEKIQLSPIKIIMVILASIISSISGLLLLVSFIVTLIRMI